MINMSEGCRVKEMNFEALGLQKKKRKKKRNLGKIHCGLQSRRHQTWQKMERKICIHQTPLTACHSLGWKLQLSSPRQQRLNEGLMHLALGLLCGQDEKHRSSVGGIFPQKRTAWLRSMLRRRQLKLPARGCCRSSKEKGSLVKS